MSKSLSENCEGCCGEGFWLWARRRGRSIPVEGCNDRANAAHRQKTRRPEGFRANSRLASLLLGRRPTKGILPCRAKASAEADSSRLAFQLFARKQHPSEFSDRL